MMSKIGVLLKRCIWAENIARILSILIEGFPAGSPTSNRLFGPPVALSATYLFGWALIITATLIRKRCYEILGPMFTFELAIRGDHRLVQTGPYSVVRHPSYSAFILLNCGVMITHCGSEGPYLLYFISPNLKMTYNAFVFGVSVWSSYLFIARADVEEKVLVERFGTEWNAWANRVPKFFPRLWW
ncbi:hypothetical protein B0H17DRAFT_1021431 [Mycena rosella]|uniref:Protein-S-isoprenylcysteine O-methyltransferase n=1 Tax=Mycena rosella TaxID=1033263 RepID=A0AAD7CPA3_MYCRO|nr:hypothetical protein B0H17DRAFT_1021431 [Mycena rosella]